MNAADGFIQSSASQRDLPDIHTQIAERENTNPLIEVFQTLLDTTPVGVKFYFDEEIDVECKRPDEPVRFCQAVDHVSKTSNNLLLSKGDISCPAARIALGFEDDPTVLIDCSEKLVEAGRFKNVASAMNALHSMQKIQRKTLSILLSRQNVAPDVYVLKLDPSHFMRLLQAYQREYDHALTVEITGVMPVCGCCSAQTFVTDSVCISFGYEDSREYGNISEDQLVVGIPCSMVAGMLKSLSEMSQHN